MIYWLLLAFSVAFYIVVQYGASQSPAFQVHSAEENKNFKKYFIFVTIAMIVLVGLRDLSVGIDTENYYDYYTTNAERDFSYLLENDVRERGYVFIQILFNKLGIGFVGFNMGYAIFNFCVVSRLIYKHSKMPWLSYFLYFCFSFYMLSFTMIRQTLAMSIVILAVMTDKNEGFWSFVKFALIVYIASLFHSSAIVAIPLWFVKKLKFNKNLTVVILIAAFVGFVFKSQLASFVIKFAASISDKYETYNTIESGNAGFMLYLMMLVSVIFGFMLKTFLYEKDNAFFFYSLCIMLLIFPAVQGGEGIMRIYYYFYIFMIVYIPNMIESIKKEEHFYLKLFVLMLYIGVGLYCFRSDILHNIYGVVPYRFFSGVN